MKLSEKHNFTLAFNGDSITHGGRGLSMDCNHIMGHGYQEMVSAEIGRRFLSRTPRFYNKGVSGQGLFDMAKRWDEEIIALRPDLVTVLIGINDAMDPERGFEKARWEQTYRTLLERTCRMLPETKILLMDPFYFDVFPHEDPYRDVPHPQCEPDFPLPCRNMTPLLAQYRHTVLLQMQEIVLRLSDEFGTLHICSEKVLENAIQQVPVQYITWDGVHPTLIGHRFLADAWLETAEELF